MSACAGAAIGFAGCGGDDPAQALGAPTALQPADLCDASRPTDLPAFEDPELEAAIGSELGLGSSRPLTCGDLATARSLSIDAGGDS